MDKEQLWNRYYRDLLKRAQGFGPLSDASPEDIAQETLSRALAKWDSLNSTDNLWGWLCETEVRVWHESSRRSRRNARQFEEWLLECPCEEVREDYDGITVAMLGPSLKYLASIDDRVGTATKVILSGGTLEDAAKLHGVSPSNLRVALHRLRKRFAESIPAGEWAITVRDIGLDVIPGVDEYLSQAVREAGYKLIHESRKYESTTSTNKADRRKLLAVGLELIGIAGLRDVFSKLEDGQRTSDIVPFAATQVLYLAKQQRYAELRQDEQARTRARGSVLPQSEVDFRSWVDNHNPQPRNWP